MNKDNLEKRLIEAGMSEAEAKVYLMLLSKPSMSIQEITDAINIPRSTVSVAIDKLLSVGVISSFTYGKRKNFAIKSVDAIENYIADAEREIQARKAGLGQLISSLRQSHFLSSGSSVELEVLRGEEAYKELYTRALKLKAGEEVLRINVESEKFIFAREFFREYSQQKNKKKIKTRLLLPESALGKGVQERDKIGFRETRFLPRNIYNPDAAISIWSDTVSLTVWDENLETVVVHSKQLVDIFRSIFELLWKNAKK